MLKYISLQINSDKSYITQAHKVCESSFSNKHSVCTCVGWHIYKKTNRPLHVGGVGTFRSLL